MEDSKGSEVQAPDPVAVVGIRQKLRRAQEQLDRLDADTNAFLNRLPYAVPGEFNSDRTEYIFWFREMERPPVLWGVWAGEIVHNLRSALDHAVYQATIAYTGSELDRTGFPIFTDKQSFFACSKETGNLSKSAGLYQIRGVSPALQTFIEQTQPYNTPNPDDSPLAGLHAFWNQDKHRVLLLAGAVAAESSITVTPLGRDTPGFRTRLNSGPAKDGAIVASATFETPASPEVKVNGGFSFLIVPKGHWDPDSDVTISLDDMFEAASHMLNSILLRV